jgi:hypothetical protein
VLDGYTDLAQAKWAAWRSRQNREELPVQFGDLLAVLSCRHMPPLRTTPLEPASGGKLIA